MRVAIVVLGFALGICAAAAAESSLPLGKMAERAVLQSKLTLPGSTPFHLECRDY
jgi:hypothetical protein